MVSNYLFHELSFILHCDLGIPTPRDGTHRAWMKVCVSATDHHRQLWSSFSLFVVFMKKIPVI